MSDLTVKKRLSLKWSSYVLCVLTTLSLTLLSASTHYLFAEVANNQSNQFDQLRSLSGDIDQSRRKIDQLLIKIGEEAKLEIIRKRNTLKGDLDDWRMADKIDGQDFNRKFEEALIIGQSYGLDPNKMRQFFSLLKKQILRADLVANDQTYADDEPGVVKSVTGYFDWLGKEEQRVAEASADRQANRTRIFKTVSLAFFEALLEQDANAALSKFDKLRTLVKGLQEVDSEILQVEADKIAQNQKLVADFIASFPVVAETFDVIALVRGESLDGVDLSGMDRGLIMLFMIPAVGDIAQIAKRSPVTAQAMGKFSAAIKSIKDENLEFLAQTFKRSKDELRSLAQRLDTVPEVSAASNRLSSSLLAKNSDDFIGAFKNTDEGIESSKLWEQGLKEADESVNGLKGELDQVDPKKLDDISSARSEVATLEKDLTKALEDLEAKRLEAKKSGKVFDDKNDLTNIDALKNKVEQAKNKLIKNQDELMSNKQLVKFYNQCRKDNICVKKLKNTTDKDLLQKAADFEREAFGEVKMIKDKATGKDVFVNSNDGIVDKRAFSSIKDELSPAIQRLDKTKITLKNSLDAADTLKKAEAAVIKAKKTGDPKLLKKANDDLIKANKANQAAKTKLANLTPADRAALQMDEAIKRSNIKSGGQGPKGIQDIEELNLEVMNVTNQLPSGPQIGSDRDVTYQLMVGGKKIDVPHEFVESHYNKALYETLNPGAKKINLSNKNDLKRANSFGHDMDHAVTSGRHAEAYVVRKGDLSDALGGNPKTLNIEDANSLEATFQHKGIHWLGAAEEATKQGKKALALKRKGEAMRQISKQYDNMLVPRIEKEGLRPEDILPSKAVEAYRLFKQVDSGKLKPAEAEAALKNMNITLQESFELIAQGLPRVTQYNNMSYAHNIVKQVYSNSLEQVNAENMLKQSGLSWEQAKKMAQDFPKYQQTFKQGAN